MNNKIPPLEESTGICDECGKEELLMSVGNNNAFVCEPCTDKDPKKLARFNSIQKDMLADIDELLELAKSPIEKGLKKHIAKLQIIRKELLEQIK